MSARFEELAWSRTPMGELTLRRRVEPSLGIDVYEVKLGDEYLMSSLFTVAEVELARLGLGELTGDGLDVVVGGLGLGYTARAVLDDTRVRSLVVVEALSPVIDWHNDEVLPDAARLTSDPRTRLVHGDFFAMLDRPGDGLDPETPGRRFHAILVDIDHSPRHVLNPRHSDFYSMSGLHNLRRHLNLDGVFALWADGQPDPDFTERLTEVFDFAHAHVVTFPNHLISGESASTVYTAR